MSPTNPPSSVINVGSTLPPLKSTTDKEDMNYSLHKDSTFDRSETTATTAIDALVNTAPPICPPAPTKILIRDMVLPPTDHSNRPTLVVDPTSANKGLSNRSGVTPYQYNTPSTNNRAATVSASASASNHNTRFRSKNIRAATAAASIHNTRFRSKNIRAATAAASIHNTRFRSKNIRAATAAASAIPASVSGSGGVGGGIIGSREPLPRTKSSNSTPPRTIDNPGAFVSPTVIPASASASGSDPNNSELLMHQRTTILPVTQQRNEQNSRMSFNDSAHAGITELQSAGGGGIGGIGGIGGSLKPLQRTTSKKLAPPKTTKPYIYRIDPSYQHSVNTHTVKSRQNSQKKFLSNSIPHIKNLCSSCGFPLSMQSQKSLDDSEGEYVHYINPGTVSRVSTTFLGSGVNNADAFNNNSPSSSHRKISMGGSRRFGSYVEHSTAESSETYMRQLYNFFAIIGDYMSMVILLEHPPDNCPPMDPLSILMFLYHRMEVPGTPLFRDHYKETKVIPLMDVFNRQVTSEGSCRSKLGLTHVFQPIRVLHRQRNMVGAYVPQCRNCMKLYETWISEATQDYSLLSKCHYHSFINSKATSIFGDGNPVESEYIIIGKKAMDKLEDTSGHVAKTRDALYPPEIKSFWQLLYAQGFSREDFMRYTMLLQAITLGNRICGVLGAKFSSFNDHLDYGDNSVEYGIQSIGVSVQEKNEKEKTVYRITFKNDHPWACFMRHLLIFTHIERSEPGMHPDIVQDGYFVDELGNKIIPPPDLGSEFVYPLPLSPKVHAEYIKDPVEFIHGEPAIDRSVKRIRLEKRQDRDFKTKSESQTRFLKGGLYKAGVLSKEDDANIGNHSTRKMTYLWGILGGGDLELIKEHVRHKTGKCEELYRGDSCTIKKMVDERPDLSAAMSIYPFEPSVIKHDQTNMRRLKKYSTTLPLPNISSIQCLAKYFVEEMLHVSPTNEFYKDHNYLLKIAYSKNFKPSTISNLEELIKTTPMSYERRQQFFRAVTFERAKGTIPQQSNPVNPPTQPSIGRETTNEGVGVTTPTTPTTPSSTVDHVPPPGPLGVFGTSFELNLQCPIIGPVEEFKLLEFHQQNKPTPNKTYFRMNPHVMTNFRKLVGRPSVFACHRLIHEVASTTAYTYDKRTAVHSLIDPSGSNTHSFSVLDHLDLCIIRAHRHYKHTFRYFADCLYGCHSGKPERFFTHHSDWAIVPCQTQQTALCTCISEKCLSNKNQITPKTHSKKRKCLPPPHVDN